MTARYLVSFSDESLVDLADLAIRIAEDRGEAVADRYITHLETYCRGLCLFPYRGHLHPGIAPDQRVVGFERRVSIYFRIVGDQVIIERLLYAGRQL
ncbi:type II toxin-antitoxin system RelE/ParE family toxin [Niveispirillum sp. KHB5.9]|uniref:type II toxin-antitoxin system RelE/ParE family toxin n=1 Tax=Niveispirillum sp. KHB5.9 TaxID=3400269 RepID=UPI003A83E88B